jgi:hypothetical protein
MTKYLTIGATIESTYGTIPGGQSYTPVRARVVSYPVDRGVMVEENIESYIPTAGYGGALKVNGSIEGNLRPIQMITLFHSLMGVKTATATPAAGFDFTLGSPSSFNMKIGEETGSALNLENIYRGCGVKSANLNFAAKEFVVAKFDWLAKIYDPGTFSAPTDGAYSTEEPIVFYNAEIVVDGIQSVRIKSLSLDINRSIDEERFVVGDYTLQELGINGMTDVSGNIVFTEHEYAEFKRALFGVSAGTALDTENKIGDVQVVITGTDIGSSEVDKIIITMPHMLYVSTDTTISGQSEVEKRINFKVVGSDFKVFIAS